jgi:VCBS repeat-containing protein
VSFQVDDGALSDHASNTLMVAVAVTPVNDAPVALDDEATTGEDTPVTIDALANDSDAEGNALVATVVAGPAHGTLVVNAGQTFTYTPDRDFNGLDRFTYVVNDGLVDSSPATVSITITAVNDAPTLASGAKVTLSGTNEDSPSAGTAVSAILAAATATDVDIGTAIGIAVTSTSGNGNWQYSGDGANWTSFGAVSASNALLLAPDALLRYLPDGLNGEVASFNFKAWDQTSASASTDFSPAHASVVSSGGDTAFSGGTASASISVSPVNDAPILRSGAVVSLPGTDVDTISSATAVSTMLSAASWADVDGGALSGIAVTASSGNGIWQYSGDGQSWTDLGAVSPSNALLLTSNSRLRYVPDHNLGETAGLVFKAWDQTTGTASTNANPAYASTALSGATTAFSDNSATASMAVASVLRTLLVSRFTATDSGFALRFNRAIDPAPLNLYDTQASNFGAADVVLMGPAGKVAGSVVIDADKQGLRFLRTGGALAAGNYTVTLASRANGFAEPNGALLDGNSDGVAGGDYVKNFSVTASGALLAIPDIARGPGQALNQPAAGSGLPLSLSNAVGANRVDFTLDYNPALLTVTGVALGAGVPAGSTISSDLSLPGRVVVTVNFGATIASAAELELVRIQATVPLTAADQYGAKQVLDLSAVAINQGAMAVRADDGIAVNAYLGDATANRGYDTLDVQRLQRVVVGLDTGFAAFPLLDPAILGDTNGDKIFNALDVQRLQQRVVGLPQTSIPPLPTPALALQTFAGADPTLSVGFVQAQPGATVVVTIEIDRVEGLESVQMTLAYPSQWLTLNAVRQVGATADFAFSAIQTATPGIITIDVSRLTPIAGSGAARLFELEFKVANDAPAGDLAVDLMSAALNDTALTLNPNPQPGPDASDGRISVQLASAMAGLAMAEWDAGGSPWQRLAPTLTRYKAEPKVTLDLGPTTVAQPWQSGRREWLTAFVNDLGRSRAVNPNANLRVTLPVAAKPVQDLGLLERQ